ncbi:MAG: motility associated factor glycosyltransferase family protein [Lachnospiraceae bacterium]|nr:motility associated factor glycosyltransferase family protein [Lachnospiraceae bacterium]
MRSIYDENLIALKKKYPAIADAIVRGSETAYERTADIADVEGRSVLYTVYNDSQYQLDSLYESEALVNRWYFYYKGDENALYRGYIVFGLGNGMFVKKLVQELSGRSDYDIIVYEPDISILKAAIRGFDLSGLLLNDKLRLYVRETADSSFGVLLDTIIDLKKIGNTLTVSYPNYPVLFPNEYNDFLNAVRINAESVEGSMYANEKYGQAYYSNILDNFSKYVHSKSIASLKEKLPRDLSAIIVSSGPSLSKNIRELHKARGKCLLIAVDSAMPILLHEGITPDLYASIDGKKFLAHFEDEKTIEIPILTAPSATPGAIREGQTAFFERDENRYIGAFLDREGIEEPVLSTGGTVANTVFAFAEYLGVKSIILCGQDLAYTGDKAHAENSLSDNNSIEEESLTYTKDINGETVKTSVVFMLYKDWFEREIAKYGVKTIDATEGGAYIEGTIIKTLREAIAEECTENVDIARCIEESAPLFSEDERKKLSAYMDELPEKLGLIVSDAKKSLRNYDRMYTMAKTNQLQKGELTRLLRDNDEINKRLDNDPAMSFVEYLIQDAIRKLAESAYQSAGDVREEILAASETGREHAKAIIEKAEWIKKDLVRRDVANS